MTREADLAYWIMAREDIRIRRKSGMHPPWTGDPLMANIRYCNVRREDDKVTRYLAKHWRTADLPIWALVAARMINYIPTLEEMARRMSAYPLSDSLPAMKLACQLRRMDGEKVFTSAYTISTAGQKIDKLDYVFDQVVTAVKEAETKNYFDFDTLADAHITLSRVKGLGSFLAAQVVADLKNTTGHPLKSAPDWQTWAAPGPGSLRGLTAFHGHPITARFFESAINVAWADTKPLLREELHDLHMQDFQNCLCEFSKYWKAKNGEGHPRNRYVPGAG